MVTRARHSALPTEWRQLCALRELRPIHDEVNLDGASELAGSLSEIPEDEQTPDQRSYLESLSLLIEKYEDEVAGAGMPTVPLELLQFLLEENNMTASDLGRLLGQRELGSKILKGARKLSKSHIATLAHHFSVGPELFLG